MAQRRSFGEFDGIEELCAALPMPGELVDVGIGDDAAVLQVPKRRLVVSVDASLEGTHFDLAWMSLGQAAERSFHAAVSDLAAMAATPLAAVCALEIPRGADRRVFAAIGKGQARAARDLSCPVVGGNVASGVRFGFTTTVLGTLGSPALLRSGAQPGDCVWLSHEAGWAALGLYLFQRGLVSRVGRRFEFSAGLGKWAKRAVTAFTTPSAKLVEASEWGRRVNSLIDTSDSVASEAQHLAAASKVRLVLDAAQLLEAHRSLGTACFELGLDHLQLVLVGGEDYGLLGTGPRARRPTGALEIGHVESGRGAWLRRGGKLVPLSGGFDHLRAP